MDDQEPREPRLPHVEGLSNFGSIEKDAPPISPFNFSAAGTLGDFSKEYALFNHGALFSYAGMEVDPVSEYMTTNSCELRFVMAEQPFFSGVSAGKREFKHWDYCMLAVPIDQWRDLASWLVESGILNRSKQTFYKAYYDSVQTVDWKQVTSQGVFTKWPMVDVALFGLDGNKSFVRVDKGHNDGSLKNPPIPGLSRMSPNAAAVGFAKAMFDGSDTPYNPDPNGNGQKL